MEIKKSPEEVSDRFIEELIKRVIIPIVKDVRMILLYSFHTENGKHENYRGLCDIATDMVLERINMYMETYFKHLDFELHDKHGEQRHNPKISSENWVLQHTWGYFRIGSKEIYIDPTSSQFKDIWDDIPDFYVSTDPPKWYYDDRKNPAFNGITRKLNETIKIPMYLKDGEDSRWVKDGIVEFCQYALWGYISDALHNII